MSDAKNHLIGLIFGRWWSQTLYAGVDLGEFSLLREYANRVVEIDDQCDVDRDPEYRLLRSLGSLESFDGQNEKVSHD